MCQFSREELSEFLSGLLAMRQESALLINRWHYSLVATERSMKLLDLNLVRVPRASGARKA